MAIVLFAAILPFVLWPIEFIFPYPYIIEELAKVVLVFFIFKTPGKSSQISLIISAGLLFAFSESVLYLSNIMLVGTVWTFVWRLLLTSFLHVLTMLIIFVSGIKKRKFLLFGVIIAMILHYYFNVFISVNSSFIHPSL